MCLSAALLPLLPRGLIPGTDWLLVALRSSCGEKGLLLSGVPRAVRSAGELPVDGCGDVSCGKNGGSGSHMARRAGGRAEGRRELLQFCERNTNNSGASLGGANLKEPPPRVLILLPPPPHTA